MTERYLVTGANGQDGTYLVELLLGQGAEVHALCHSPEGAARLAAEYPGAQSYSADLRDGEVIAQLVQSVEPTRVINLAGNTSVARSWDYPAEAAEVLGLGPVRLLEEIKSLIERSGREVRFLQASSAEIFGDATEIPQNESTLIRPVTPYGAAKAFAHGMTAMYRARGLHVSTAILYNHESPRRPEAFVARKIAQGVVRIASGLQDALVLGNIDAERDWGYAPDYVDAMVRIIESESGDDFVVATGRSHSVREFVALAFENAGIPDWEPYVTIDPALYRPADPRQLVGDPAKLLSIGWRPTVDFAELVRIMVSVEFERVAAAGSK